MQTLYVKNDKGESLGRWFGLSSQDIKSLLEDKILESFVSDDLHKNDFYFVVISQNEEELKSKIIERVEYIKSIQNESQVPPDNSHFNQTLLEVMLVYLRITKQILDDDPEKLSVFLEYLKNFDEVKSQ